METAAPPRVSAFDLPDVAPRVLAGMDIGTNSIRLQVVRVGAEQATTIISQQREMVRLGEGEFAEKRITREAIDRGALVCARFADMARGFGAAEIIALATSAVREAENRDDFVSRVRDEAGIDVRVISGREEARLIYLGVASGAALGDRRALFIDIGGGSTELIVGDTLHYDALDSLKLGAIRMSNHFLKDDPRGVSPARFEQMQAYARGVAGHSVRKMRQKGFDLACGSSGTINSLAAVTARRLGESPSTLRNYTVSLPDLRETVSILCKLPLAERRNVPGLDPGRADIIIGGAAVLLTILEDARVDTLMISDRGLRDGIILDAVAEEADRAGVEATSTRLRSILKLCRACGFDEAHGHQVQRLSFMMFDELARLKLHAYGERERELLGYAALCHDIGCFLSHSGHERHAYYLVRHSDLLGFDDTEIDIIANVALYHRKSAPKRSHQNLADLPKQMIRLVEALSAILRVAEGLDRSHLGLVRRLSLSWSKRPAEIRMHVLTDGAYDLEMWGVDQTREPFEKTFGAPLKISMESTGSEAAAHG
jgi:exopolyphosphatase/guanosine-5'-triphosphate,3'-diphosphate pyrophosphatase